MGPIPAHWIVLGGVTVITACSYWADGLAGVLLLHMAALPVAVWLHLLTFMDETKPRAGLLLFYFISGCSVSIICASVLESTSQLSSIRVWSCEAQHKVTWQCNVAFSISLLISIGLVEEFSKALPLFLMTRVNADHVPHRNKWLYYVVDSPKELVLAGCASGGGFACVENIKYVLFSANSFEEGFDTSIVRALLAVPFHIACTGIVAAIYSDELFTQPTTFHSLEDGVTLPAPPRRLSSLIWKNIVGLIRARRPEQSNSDSDGAKHAFATSMTSSWANTCNSPLLPPPLEETTTQGVRKSRGLLSWIVHLLSVSVLCHTAYDLSLFMATQFISKSSIGLGICAATYVVSYCVSMIVFLRRWNRSIKASRSAIPRLHPHLDPAL